MYIVARHFFVYISREKKQFCYLQFFVIYRREIKEWFAKVNLERGLHFHHTRYYIGGSNIGTTIWRFLILIFGVEKLAKGYWGSCERDLSRIPPSVTVAMTTIRNSLPEGLPPPCLYCSPPNIRDRHIQIIVCLQFCLFDF